MNQLQSEHSTVYNRPCRQRLWSQRCRIARELRSWDRSTVARYAKEVVAKPATNPAAGSPPGSETKPAISTAGSEAAEEPKPASNLAPGLRPGPPSLCEPFTIEIEAAVQAGLSAQRIYQDLVREHDFRGAYGSVKRFVRGLTRTFDLPFRRMECAPGEEMQVDFGQGAWVVEDGKRRRPHLFRAVLSHSRKGYSEVVWHQDTETFVRCQENAFPLLWRSHQDHRARQPQSCGLSRPTGTTRN